MNLLLHSPSNIVNPLARQRFMGFGTGSSGGAGGFSPLSISSLTEWFDIASLAAVGNNNPVSSWAGNKSVYTLTGSGTARPTYVANDGDGNPAVQTDGVDDTLITAVNRDVMFSLTAGEQWFVIRPRSLVGFQGIGGYGNGSDNYFVAFYLAATLFLDAPDNGANRTTVSAPSGWLDNWHVVRLVWNGTNRQIWVDGVQLVSATKVITDIPNTAQNFRLGLASGAGYGVYSYRHALTFNALLTTDEALAITNYLEGFT
jgi:hypothetical protein